MSALLNSLVALVRDPRFISADGSNWDNTQMLELFEVVDWVVLDYLLQQLDWSVSGLTSTHIAKAVELAITKRIRVEYRKRGISIGLSTSDFTASGVFDRTSLNFLRQYIGASCQTHLSWARHIPSTATAPNVCTGDDGLRVVG